MNNADKYDDIDLMIVTSPNTLWITRAVVVLLLKLKKLRRNPGLPEHSSPRVSNKICDNLYIEADHLLVFPLESKEAQGELYVSHEVLQAKPIFDRGGIHHRFIKQNSWTKKYLPVAYRELLKNQKKQKTITINKNYFLWPVNFAFFLAQYIFMKPKLTTERVSLHSAFFHPNAPLDNNPTPSLK